MKAKTFISSLTFFMLCATAQSGFAQSLIYFPSPYPEGNWEPEDLDFEDATFVAADGTLLHGWYIEHPDPEGYVLYAHGNAGNVTHRASTMKRISERLGFSILVFDYRGYGKSEGEPSEEGLYLDADAALAWLMDRARVDTSEVIIWGRSLGGGVAVDLASRVGARALILESTFTSTIAVGERRFPGLPVAWLLRNDRFDSLSKIDQYDGPLFQSHGSADSTIPIDIGEELFAAANEPKSFFRIAGAGHNDRLESSYYDAVAEFFEDL